MKPYFDINSWLQFQNFAIFEKDSELNQNRAVITIDSWIKINFWIFRNIPKQPKSIEWGNCQNAESSEMTELSECVSWVVTWRPFGRYFTSLCILITNFAWLYSKYVDKSLTTGGTESWRHVESRNVQAQDVQRVGRLNKKVEVMWPHRL